MRRKMFFMLPDPRTAHQMMDQMLLARIEDKHIRFLAKPDIPMDGLPEATIMEKTDSLNGTAVGAVIGAVTGVLGGIVVVMYPALVVNPHSGFPLHIGATVAIAAAGAFFGAWWCSLLSTAIPNSRLKPYLQRISQGEILMIVDVPFHRIHEIRERVNGLCGDACNLVSVSPTDHVIFP